MTMITEKNLGLGGAHLKDNACQMHSTVPSPFIYTYMYIEKNTYTYTCISTYVQYIYIHIHMESVSKVCILRAIFYFFYLKTLGFSVGRG